MSRLSARAYPNDAPIHGLTAHRYTSTPALNGYWVWNPRPSLSPRHCWCCCWLVLLLVLVLVLVLQTAAAAAAASGTWYCC
jgi:hypothetical protein